MANFPLQLSRAFHNPAFQTREDALYYIENTILVNTPPAEGEPILISYGDTNNPGVILGIGTTPGNVYLLDVGDLQDQINKKVDVENSGVLVSNIDITDITTGGFLLAVALRDTSDGSETTELIAVTSATQSEAGLMSAYDKLKLDELPTNAELELRFVGIENDVSELKEKTGDLQDQINALDDISIKKNGIENKLFGVVNDKLFEIPNSTKEIWANKNAIHDDILTDGSKFFPYKSLSGAIGAITPGTSQTIHISGGSSFDEGATLLVNEQNLSILLDGADGQFRSELLSNLEIGGESTKVGVHGFQIGGNLNLTTTVGGIYVSDMAIRGVTTISGVGYYNLRNVQLMGHTNITGACQVFIDGGSNEEESVITVNNPDAFVVLKDISNVTLNVVDGTVIVQGSTNFISSEKLPGFGDRCIVVQGGSIDLMSGTALQADGTYAPIEVYTSAEYRLGAFLFEPSSSVFNGKLNDGGLHTIQLYDHNSRDGYKLRMKEDEPTVTVDTLDSHLDGISDVLVDIDADVSTIQTDITELDGRIGGVEVSVATLQTDLVDLDGRVTVNEGNISNINERVNVIEGGVGFLPAFDFGDPELYPSPTVWQATLNAYAIGGDPGQGPFAGTVFPQLVPVVNNGLSLRNIFDGHRWTYSDVVLEWTDQGLDVVSVATNSTAGIVKGVASGELGTIAVTNLEGEMSVNGLSQALDLKADLSWVQDELDLKADQSSLESVNTTLVDGLYALDNRVSDLETDMTIVKEDILGLKNSTGNLDDDVAALQNGLYALDNRVGANEDNILELQGDVVTLKSDMATAQGDIIALDDDVAALQNGLYALDNRVGANEDNIIELQGDIIALDGGVAALQNGLAVLDNRVGANEDNILELKNNLISETNNRVQDVAGLQTQIDSLTTDNVILSDRVAALEDEVNALKSKNVVGGEFTRGVVIVNGVEYRDVIVLKNSDSVNVGVIDITGYSNFDIF